MKLSPKKLAATLLLCAQALVSHAFEIASDEFTEHTFLNKSHEFQGFGCDGQNRSPQLSWHNAPKGTQSFAITVHDPDAPTGSGWWHWLVYNLPATTQTLVADAGTESANTNLPKGAVQAKNDYGIHGFGGACPPKGHGVHHYQITVYAIKEKQLEIPKDASAALVGYMLNANALGKAQITGLYQR